MYGLVIGELELGAYVHFVDSQLDRLLHIFFRNAGCGSERDRIRNLYEKILPGIGGLVTTAFDFANLGFYMNTSLMCISGGGEKMWGGEGGGVGYNNHLKAGFAGFLRCEGKRFGVK